MGDGKHRSNKNGGDGPVSTKGPNLSGRNGLSDYQKLCREVLLRVNKGKKRKIPQYLIVEIMAVLTDLLSDKEQGLMNIKAILFKGKTRQFLGKGLKSDD